jgi:hypothetical protein
MSESSLCWNVTVAAIFAMKPSRTRCCFVMWIAETIMTKSWQCYGELVADTVSDV